MAGPLIAIFGAIAAAGNPKYVLTARTLADVKSDPTTATVAFRVRTNGNFETNVAGVWTTYAQEYVVPKADGGSKYECRVTKVSGTALSSGPADAAWVTISTDRTYTYLTDTVESLSGVFDLDIGLDSVESALLTARITMSADQI